MFNSEKDCPICKAPSSLEVANYVVKDGKKYYGYRCVCCGGIIPPNVPEDPKPDTAGSEAEDIMGKLYKFASDKLVTISSYKIEGNFSSQSGVMGTPVMCSTGTGFSIGDGFYITNAHVVELEDVILGTRRAKLVPYDLVTIGPVGDKEYAAKPVAIDNSRDLALLYSPHELDPLYINVDTKVGSRVFAIGNSKDEGMRLSWGIYDGDDVVGEYEFDFMRHTAMSATGNSGGPLFNDFGDVIGVNSKSDFTFSDAYYAVPATELVNFIDEVNAETHAHIKLRFVK